MISPAQIREVEEFLREHDAFMAQPPVLYRGYSIKPTSHKVQPFFIKGRYVYWGFMICDEAGHTNKGPAAVWFYTIDEAKFGIDCIHKAGGHGRHYLDSAWIKDFWELIRERWPVGA